MRKIIGLAFLCFLTSNAIADSARGKKLFNRHSCNQCHIASAPTPAMIAEKYQGKIGSAENLTSQFKNGAFNKNANATARHNAAVSEMSESDIQNVMQWLSGDTSSATASTASSTSKPDSSSGAAVLGAVGAIAGVYIENQEAKSNSRSRSRATPQASTQTSQNNYPSDNSYGNNAGTQSNNSETSTDAMHCVNIFYSDRGYPRFRNTCNFRINIYACVGRECGTSGGRLQSLNAGGTTNVYADPGQDFKYAACPDPYYARYSTSGFDGNFTCRR